MAQGVSQKKVQKYFKIQNTRKTDAKQWLIEIDPQTSLPYAFNNSFKSYFYNFMHVYNEFLAVCRCTIMLWSHSLCYCLFSQLLFIIFILKIAMVFLFVFLSWTTGIKWYFSLFSLLQTMTKGKHQCSQQWKCYNSCYHSHIAGLIFKILLLVCFVSLINNMTKAT